MQGALSLSSLALSPHCRFCCVLSLSLSLYIYICIYIEREYIYIHTKRMPYTQQGPLEQTPRPLCALSRPRPQSSGSVLSAPDCWKLPWLSIISSRSQRRCVTGAALGLECRVRSRRFPPETLNSNRRSEVCSCSCGSASG